MAERVERMPVCLSFQAEKAQSEKWQRVTHTHTRTATHSELTRNGREQSDFAPFQSGKKG